MRGKKDIERELIHAEAKIETLQALLDSAQADRVELKSQVTKLQDALVAAQAPEAYRDQQLAREEEDRIPMSQEAMDRNKLIQDTTTEYIAGLEKPLFRDANDLDDLLARSAMRAIKPPASLHRNEES
jgi:peptidoglycan hydrolase CwlO-like protein